MALKPASFVRPQCRELARERGFVIRRGVHLLEALFIAETCRGTACAAWHLAREGSVGLKQPSSAFSRDMSGGQTYCCIHYWRGEDIAGI